MHLRINEIAVVKRVFESDNLTKQIVKSSNPAKPLTTVKLLMQMQLTMKSSKKEGSIRDGALSAYEVSPLDDTALVTAVSIPSSEAIGNHSTGADDDWTDQIRGIVGG